MNLGLDPSLTHELHRDDPDRFWCLVPVPPAARPPVAALLAFNQELGRVAEQVTQPMAGFIRLQWWREAIEEARAGRARRQPVAQALPLIQAAGLPDERLEGLVDARERELDEAPITDLEELKAHVRATAGALQAGVATLTGGEAERARRIGTAYGLVGILRATGHLAAGGRCLLPADLLESHGVSRSAVLAGETGEGLRAVARQVAQAAEAEMRGLRPRRGEAATPLLLITRHQLRALGAAEYDPFAAASIGRPRHLALRLLLLQGLGW
ncbi:phytoene/squalene synthase family protein [Geminicoccus roseus]|uniref:phytoene/squalene synthase family protein n=1 Tax=Geminicoccus roseus TaxID=404900 RepID=UPI00040218FC|nr:squalene/phytoene synthase family protein [Geminicoccus roseus]